MKQQLSKALSTLVANLDRFPQIQTAKVFGSLLVRPSEAQDIDIAFIHEEDQNQDVLRRYLPVVQVGAYRGNFYGLLDVFVSFKNTLLVRDSDCNGFELSKNAAKIKKNIEEHGVSWEEWRNKVELHPDIQSNPMRPATVYFAHPITTYCSKEEDRAIKNLEAAGLVVINPSDRVHHEACGSDMNKWTALAATCDSIALLSFPDGSISAGASMEVDQIHAQGKPIYRITNYGAVMPVSSWPGNFKVLSTEETRAIVNPFRDKRKALGLTPVPIKEEKSSSKIEFGKKINPKEDGSERVDILNKNQNQIEKKIKKNTP